ncbi:MAG TPA: hypothetical protein ENK93_03460 [Campylobacteraceae bacterium]|jgi:hypothetical protein|nr:hypothetical protein [Campylobacteraceae bacterium]HHD83915.1 hypothetical protein [Campylobacteraceae bacterium]
MVELSISDISKKPSLLDELDDIAKIVNKKTGEAKGIFIPYEDASSFKKLLEELEYRRWLKRNRGLLENPPEDMEGLFDEVISELGDRIIYEEN